MPKQVKGFLATDGTFFEHQPECKRYELMKEIQGLCESHNINFENFMSLINSWNKQIEGYLNEDSKCKVKQANGGTVQFESAGDDVSHVEDDNEDPPVRNKDTPGFLEQSLGRYK